MAVIYLAAPSKFHEEAKKVRDHFVANGIDVNSRWLELNEVRYDKTPEEMEREAIEDLEDICASDGMVVLHYAPSEGKSFEQGFFLGISGALQKNNKMIVILPEDYGFSENVFHSVKDIYNKVSTVEEAINLVKEWQ